MSADATPGDTVFQFNRSLVRMTAWAACAVAPAAEAIEPIPETPGWRGFVLAGAGYIEFETNLVAGNTIVDIGNTTIDSVNDAPESDSASRSRVKATTPQ